MGDKDGGAARELGTRDYARLAGLSDEELTRQCRMQVFRAHGPGGQGVNTTDSAVRLTHVPTGITVTARDSRSQHRNRQACLEKLRRIFARRSVPAISRKQTKVPRTQRERRLADKRRRSDLKRLRGRPDRE